MNPPAVQETLVQSLGWEDPLELGIGCPLQFSCASLVAQIVKNLPAMSETWVWSPGEGHGYPLQYSCLENPTDGGAWRAMGQSVTESNTTEGT